jgi:hypothetical protein
VQRSSTAYRRCETRTFGERDINPRRGYSQLVSESIHLYADEKMARCSYAEFFLIIMSADVRAYCLVTADTSAELPRITSSTLINQRLSSIYSRRSRIVIPSLFSFRGHLAGLIALLSLPLAFRALIFISPSSVLSGAQIFKRFPFFTESRCKCITSIFQRAANVENSHPSFPFALYLNHDVPPSLLLLLLLLFRSPIDVLEFTWRD